MLRLYLIIELQFTTKYDKEILLFFRDEITSSISKRIEFFGGKSKLCRIFEEKFVNFMKCMSYNVQSLSGKKNLETRLKALKFKLQLHTHFEEIFKVC